MHVPDSTGEHMRAPTVKSNLHGLAIQSNLIVPVKGILCHSSTLELHIGSAVGLPTAGAQTQSCSNLTANGHAVHNTVYMRKESMRTGGYLVSSYLTPHFFNCPLTENSSCKATVCLLLVGTSIHCIKLICLKVLMHNSQEHKEFTLMSLSVTFRSRLEISLQTHKVAALNGAAPFL